VARVAALAGGLSGKPWRARAFGSEHVAQVQPDPHWPMRRPTQPSNLSSPNGVLTASSFGQIIVVGRRWLLSALPQRQPQRLSPGGFQLLPGIGSVTRVHEPRTRAILLQWIVIPEEIRSILGHCRPSWAAGYIRSPPESRGRKDVSYTSHRAQSDSTATELALG